MLRCARWQRAWEAIKATCGTDALLIVSNSAGSADDAGGREALAVEAHLGVRVLRHTAKKPSAACAQVVLEALGCPAPHHVVVVGDRVRETLEGPGQTAPRSGAMAVPMWGGVCVHVVCRS
jgi:hypothetical protein